MEWSLLECEVIVADYLDMLGKELKGDSYQKSAHRRLLQTKLNNRSDGSIEYKHQNVSAILIELGYPYISGYKPAFNYQQLLKHTVESNLDNSTITQTADELITQEPDIIQELEWVNVLTDTPVTERVNFQTPVRDFIPRQYNFTDRERQNRKLGVSGEEFVLRYERQRLSKAGREDLVNDVEWTSQVKGDGAGYDIRSFNPDNEAELFIEVKTTKLGKYLPFYISDNEVEFSKLHQEQYSLYRVFEFRKDPKLFILDGDISERINLHATIYRASF
ncbi:DUF3883 domain-containing protein [Sulfuriflexus mobilis]|uniref:DUF3883 domain-containing protein n=1 Tax=Sulfuriflexus mobilis TaxID=1811807 RepID=UPI000F84855B|nr:DUF3883 domain-containing protein [Sulfuriflexus mobilis]